MSDSKMIYLGKSGKMFGPYSQREFEQMAVDGRLDQFVWMWKELEKKWIPIEAPPSLIPTSALSFRIQAICYDISQVVQGTLEAITQTGCRLVSPANGEVPKVFLSKNAHLSLVDEESGEDCRVPVQLFKHEYRSGMCFYWLRWNEPPALLNK